MALFGRWAGGLRRDDVYFLLIRHFLIKQKLGLSFSPIEYWRTQNSPFPIAPVPIINKTISYTLHKNVHKLIFGNSGFGIEKQI